MHTGKNPDDEPNILASQASQVYYVPDKKHRDWQMVVHLKPRDLYDMGHTNNPSHDSETLETTDFGNFLPEGDDDMPSVR